MAATLLPVFNCMPLEKFWDRSIKGHCLKEWSSLVRALAPNILTDLILLVLPIPLLMRLQMKTSRKLLTIGVFVAGYR